MLDRIVPVHRTDLMSLYYFAVGLGSSVYPLKATAPGEFDLTAATGSDMFLSEPAKKIQPTAAMGTNSVYFVPDFDFDGFYTADGQKAELAESSVVVPDGRTLHTAAIADGEIVVAPESSLEHALDALEG